MFEYELPEKIRIILDTHTSPNGFKLQIDFLIINKKWKNSVKNCREYNSFISLASDHHIISADIRLCLRANTKKLCNNKPYDWTRLTTRC